MGKSYVTKNNTSDWKITDSDSSKFSWIVDPVTGEKTRNPNFIKDYMSHIWGCTVEFDIIFVSTHKEVRKALLDSAGNFPFFIAYPKREAKDFYLECYKQRGSNDAFIKLMNDHWDEFIDEIEEDIAKNRQIIGIQLDSGEHLSIEMLKKRLAFDFPDRIRFQLAYYRKA